VRATVPSTPAAANKRKNMVVKWMMAAHSDSALIAMIVEQIYTFTAKSISTI
jgi:hypothetical protein